MIWLVLTKEYFMDNFDPHSAIEAAKSERKLRKHRKPQARPSKLNPHQFEIKKMYESGASLSLIELHLRTEHNLSASRSTILRFLQKAGIVKNG